MAVTVATVEASVQLDFPDVPTADVFTALTEEHAKLCHLYPLYESSETFSSLVDGTSEYNFSTVPASVRHAVYKPSSTNSGWTTLRATTIDALNSDNPSWRQSTPSQPTHYYTTTDGTNFKLGLYPAPNTTSSGGYPAVTVYTWLATTLSTNMPVSIDAYDCYKYGTCYRLALQKNDPRVATYKALYEEAKRVLHKQTLGVVVNAPSKFTPIDLNRSSRTV